MTNTKLILFLTTLIIFPLVTKQEITQLEILKAANRLRTHPQEYAAIITQKYISKGVTGIAGDEKCYQEAVKALTNQKALQPLTEEAGIDIAAYKHSKDILEKIKKLSHTGSDNSSPEDRLKREGRFIAGKNYVYELVAYEKSNKVITANDIILLLVSDCGLMSRAKRNYLFSEKVDNFGAGVYIKGTHMAVTVLGTKNFTSKKLTAEEKKKANIEGDGKFKGEGSQQNKTTEKNKETFTKDKKDDTKGVTPLKEGGDNNGPLGDKKDDKSVACPKTVNSKIFQKSIIKNWSLTSKSCKRGEGDFKRTDHLAKYAPFAKKGKCYHELAYCSNAGKVWVLHREYKTLKEVDPNAPGVVVTDEQSLKNAKEDKQVECPDWLNKNLIKRFVKDWWVSGERCSRGSDGFSSKGFDRVLPFAYKRKCYQKLRFCDEGGYVWMRNSEYYTLPEWRVRHWDNEVKEHK